MPDCCVAEGGKSSGRSTPRNKRNAPAAAPQQQQAAPSAAAGVMGAASGMMSWTGDAVSNMVKSLTPTGTPRGGKTPRGGNRTPRS